MEPVFRKVRIEPVEESALAHPRIAGEEGYPVSQGIFNLRQAPVLSGRDHHHAVTDLFVDILNQVRPCHLLLSVEVSLVY